MSTNLSICPGRFWQKWTRFSLVNIRLLSQMSSCPEILENNYHPYILSPPKESPLYIYIFFKISNILYIYKGTLVETYGVEVVRWCGWGCRRGGEVVSENFFSRVYVWWCFWRKFQDNWTFDLKVQYLLKKSVSTFLKTKVDFWTFFWTFYYNCLFFKQIPLKFQ